MAALIAVGCNIGPQRMTVASGLRVHEISELADWYLSADTLKAASIDLVNFVSRLPLSRVYGRGSSCSPALLGFELAPHIRDIHDQTLYKINHSQYQEFSSYRIGR